MKLKLKEKILCAVLALILISSPAVAEVKVGFLAKLNMTQDEFRSLVISERKKTGWHLMSLKHDDGEKFYFFDSLAEMIMALNAGKIDEAVFPKIVGDYVLNVVPDLTIASVTHVRTMALTFGFYDSEKGRSLQKEFTDALISLKKNGTLLDILKKYITEPVTDNPKGDKIQFEHFNGKTVRVAVTGDLPPIDYVAEDGTPAGFSIAVLAEIGKILRKNIEVIDIDAGARTTALVSGRIDAVFWYETVKNSDIQIDVPGNVLLSEPYYDWNMFLYLKKKQN